MCVYVGCIHMAYICIFFLLLTMQVKELRGIKNMYNSSRFIYILWITIDV